MGFHGKHTQEAIEKIRNSSIGRVKSAETRKKIGDKNRGKKLSAKQIEMLRAFRLGKPAWNKGKKASIETRRKLSLAQIGRIPWNKGKKLSAEHIEKLRKAKLGKTGVLAANWKGGVSRNKHSLTNPAYFKWRTSVFERDNWTCQTCGIRGGISLEAHHIKSWAAFPELRFDIDNGVTLCIPCHRLTDNYKGRGNKKIKN